MTISVEFDQPKFADVDLGLDPETHILQPGNTLTLRLGSLLEVWQCTDIQAEQSEWRKLE